MLLREEPGLPASSPQALAIARFQVQVLSVGLGEGELCAEQSSSGWGPPEQAGRTLRYIARGSLGVPG